jgi:hypothetical protein
MIVWHKFSVIDPKCMLSPPILLTLSKIWYMLGMVYSMHGWINFMDWRSNLGGVCQLPGHESALF